jgi:hypothetical protein
MDMTTNIIISLPPSPVKGNKENIRAHFWEFSPWSLIFLLANLFCAAIHKKVTEQILRLLIDIAGFMDEDKVFKTIAYVLL